MNNLPPHLPPPTCSVPLHHRLRTVSAVSAVALIALLAGVAGGAVMQAWVWPRYVTDGGLYVPMRQSNLKPVMADVVARDLADRMATVYTRAETVATGVSVLTEKDMVGEAAIVSSDGWLVLPLSSDQLLNPVVALLGGQKLVKVEKIVEDKEAEILYIKVAAPDLAGNQTGQFKIISFADTVQNGEDVFVYTHGSWLATTVVDRGKTIAGVAHIDSLPVPLVRVLGNVEPGSLVVTASGKLVGYVLTGSLLAPVETVARVVGGVLVNGIVAYTSLGVDGWFSEETPVAVGGQIKNGFLVNKIRDKVTKLKRGDMVLEIQGSVVNSNVWWGAMVGGSEVIVKVLRQGKDVMLTTPVVKVSK